MHKKQVFSVHLEVIHPHCGLELKVHARFNFLLSLFTIRIPPSCMRAFFVLKTTLYFDFSLLTVKICNISGSSQQNTSCVIYSYINLDRNPIAIRLPHFYAVLSLNFKRLGLKRVSRFFTPIHLTPCYLTPIY